MINRISASIIADSISEQGHRLTTYILVFPRIVLSEFNTHRMISKNSASSRAIPFKTMLKRVLEEPFVPIAFQKEHKGMQGTDYFSDELVSVPMDLRLHLDKEFEPGLQHVQFLWENAAQSSVHMAELLSNAGVTKQLCNRLLEPFLYHTVICTGSEWENFFALRAHPQAEIHIADLAEKMLVAYNDSTPKELEAGEWHIPFGDTFDSKRLNFTAHVDMGLVHYVNADDAPKALAARVEKLRVKIATARCARVSYLNFEGKDDYIADIKLHDMLVASGHMSPMEHCAQAMTKDQYDNHTLYWPHPEFPERINLASRGVSGNFRGFVQYRKMLNDENKQDPRVIKK